MESVWKQLICQSCASNAVEIVDGLLCCKVCKSKHTLQEKISEEEVIMLNVAAMDRNVHKFEDALEKYEQLLQKYPDNEMANWGALLADYGIAYVKDYDEKLVPTCQRLSERPIDVCPYYYKLNDDHKARADEIEKLRLSIMKKANKIQPYDVFICYKATEDVFGRSVPTKEAGWAREIYTMLKHKLNLRVFFAEESLVGENSEWEPHIYKALNTAKLMFVLTTGKENVNAAWVKNEWKRFSRYIKEGQEKTIRVVYDVMNAYDLPKELQDTQAIHHNSMGWGEAVRKAAENIFIDPLEEERKKKEKEEKERKAREEAAAKEREREEELQKMRETMEALQKQASEPKAAPASTPVAPTSVLPADKYCVKCGAGNKKNAKFCADCGHEVFAPEYKQYCLDCGAESELLKKFCPNCKKTAFVYTRADYEKEVERKRLEELERKRQEEAARRAAEELARQEAERKARERLIAEERAKIAREFTIENGTLVAYIGANKKDVIIPNSVFRIGAYAFEACDRLTSITIPQSVNSISDEAFKGCKNLENIKVAENNANYKDINGVLYNKYGDALVRYPAGRKDSFISMPETIKRISVGAFSECENLTSIVMSNSVSSIGASVFADCVNLTDVTLPDSFFFIPEKCFYNCGKLANIVIPKDVRTIEESAFEECVSLTSVIIPASVTTIDKKAFYGCSKLREINIPQKVNSIHEEAFACCNLENITVSESNETYKDINGVLYTKDGKELILYPCRKKDEAFVIPKGVESIADRAFLGCALTKITIPKGVTSIGKWAFSSCGNLTSIEIPRGVTEIKAGTFYGCLKLKTVKLPNTVKEVAPTAFSRCPAKIPEHLKSSQNNGNTRSNTNTKKSEEERQKAYERKWKAEAWWKEFLPKLFMVLPILGLLLSLGTCFYMNTYGGSSLMGTLFIVGIVLFIGSAIVGSIIDKRKK